MLDDILSETPIYKSIERRGLERGIEQGLERGIEQGLKLGLKQGRTEGLAEGRTEGRTEGLAEGLAEGHEEERQLRLSSLRQKLLLLQQKRFPQLSQLASKRVAQITRPDVLEDLMVKPALAQDSDEAEEALLVGFRGSRSCTLYLVARDVVSNPSKNEGEETTT